MVVVGGVELFSNSFLPRETRHFFSLLAGSSTNNEFHKATTIFKQQNESSSNPGGQGGGKVTIKDSHYMAGTPLLPFFSPSRSCCTQAQPHLSSTIAAQFCLVPNCEVS